MEFLLIERADRPSCRTLAPCLSGPCPTLCGQRIHRPFMSMPESEACMRWRGSLAN